jgi:hypothetical protein
LICVNFLVTCLIDPRYKSLVQLPIVGIFSQVVSSRFPLGV